MPGPRSVTNVKPYHHGDLRAALLTAAEAVLERVGSEGLSLRELAREVGVSNTAPRRHFPTKQALIDALAVNGLDRLGNELTKAASAEEPDVVNRLINIAHARIRFCEAHRPLSRLMSAAKQRPDAAPEVVQASSNALAAGPFTIEHGQRSGVIVEGDSKQLALTVFASVEGLIALSFNGKLGGVATEDLATQVIQRIMHGLLRREGRPAGEREVGQPAAGRPVRRRKTLPTAPK